MAATGVLVGAVLVGADVPLLHPDDEASDWLGPQLKDHCELTEDETSRALAIVTGRPNFLKMTEMLRGRRTDHPAAWAKMLRGIAGVF
eukprot:5709366-Prymnesium_polylepis.1